MDDNNDEKIIKFNADLQQAGDRPSNLMRNNYAKILAGSNITGYKVDQPIKKMALLADEAKAISEQNEEAIRVRAWNSIIEEIENAARIGRYCTRLIRLHDEWEKEGYQNKIEALGYKVEVEVLPESGYLQNREIYISPIVHGEKVVSVKIFW